MLEQAAQEIDRRLTSAARSRPPTRSPPTRRKATSFVEQGRIELVQAKAPVRMPPSSWPKQRCRSSTARSPRPAGSRRRSGGRNPPPTNADAVLSSLREVDARLARLKNAGKEEGDEPAARQEGPSAGEEVVDRRQGNGAARGSSGRLAGELFQTRLLVGNAYFEKSKALPPGSAERKAVVRAPADRYRKLFEKYPQDGALASDARYYEGSELPRARRTGRRLRRVVAAAPRHSAFDAWRSICALHRCQPGFAPGALREGGERLGSSAGCRKRSATSSTTDSKRLALANVPADRLDADWLGMKIRSCPTAGGEGGGPPR
jgi:hypothetical protein